MNKYKLLLSKIYRFFRPISEVEKYRRMGVKIGEGTQIQFEVVIDYSHYWLIEIGSNVTIAPRVHLIAHDASTKHSLGYTRIGKIKIGNNVFIGAGSIILPGVNIGENSIVAAGSLVNSSIEPNSVYGGNPARKLMELEEFLQRRKTELESTPNYNESYTLRGNIDRSKMDQMISELKDGFGYVE